MSKPTAVSRLDKVFDACGQRQAYVGLDTHKRTVHVGVWVGEHIAVTWVMPTDSDQVAAMLAPHADKIKCVVYEAGPTGFGLARTLRQAGLSVEVVAPGRTPRPAARQSKSDRLDCRRLAQFAAKGLLEPVAVPTPTQEADRQLLRVRQQLVDKRRRLKQQIRSFLLQHAIAAPPGLNHWSHASVAALGQLSLGPMLRVCLDVLLDELDGLNAQVRGAMRAVRALASTPRHAEAVAIARTHPRVGLVVAMSFIVEVYCDGRFDNARQASSYLGLAPMVYASGQMRREGPIMRTGRGRVRALLVEAAWRWRMLDPVARRRYQHMVPNTGSSNKAIVALARRLAITLWVTLTRGQAYRAAAQAPQTQAQEK